MLLERVATMKAAIYLRVSTDGQTVENQRPELLAAAERHGWDVSVEFRDEGVSGAKGRDRRPGLNRLMHAVGRRADSRHWRSHSHARQRPPCRRISAAAAARCLATNSLPSGVPLLKPPAFSRS
jgi:hypothetical protein